MRKRLERRFNKSSTNDRPPPLPPPPPPPSQQQQQQSTQVSTLNNDHPSDKQQQQQRSRRKSWSGVFGGGNRRDKAIRQTRRVVPDSSIRCSSNFMSPSSVGVTSSCTFPESNFVFPPASPRSSSPIAPSVSRPTDETYPPTEEEEKCILPPSSPAARKHRHRRYLTCIKPLLALTVHLRDTYTQRNANFRYDPSQNPRRVLTKPSIGCKNHKYDNENNDYIIYVNDILGGESSSGRRYVVQDMLGSGTFGQVVKCHVLGTFQTVGVKVIKSKPAYLKQSLVEVDILRYLNTVWDPNNENHILRLLDTFTHKHHLCLVFELLSVNLYELLKQNKFRGLSINLIRMLSEQIIDVLIILQDAGVIHCDLKPENILLENLQSPAIKVIDFGSACLKSQKMYTYIQSRFYRSPEVILGMRYSSSIDMWSFGCIVAELFLGLPLFPGSSEYNQITRIINTLGLPPAYMIDQGRHAYRFFNRIERHGKICYELKSMEQYMNEQNPNEKPSKKYFSTTDLSELILKHPMPRKHMTEQEKEKEMHLREMMLDFLQKVLQIDPLQRLTPREAKRHPFIACRGETAVESTVEAMSQMFVSEKCPANDTTSMAGDAPSSLSQARPRSPVTDKEENVLLHTTGAGGEATPTVSFADKQQREQQEDHHSRTSENIGSSMMVSSVNMMGTPPLSPGGIKFHGLAAAAVSGLSTATDVTQHTNSDSGHASVAAAMPDTTTRSECHLRRRSQATHI